MLLVRWKLNLDSIKVSSVAISNKKEGMEPLRELESSLRIFKFERPLMIDGMDPLKLELVHVTLVMILLSHVTPLLPQQLESVVASGAEPDAPFISS